MAEMKKRYQLSDKSIFKYLHGLDRLGLIKLQSNNEFRFCVEGMPSWITGGALQKAYLETMFDFPKHIVNQVMSGKLHIMKEVFLHIGDSYLSTSSIQMIFKLLMEVQKTIYKQSELDQVYCERKDLQKVSAFLCFSSFDRPRKGIVNFGNLQMRDGPKSMNRAYGGEPFRLPIELFKDGKSASFFNYEDVPEKALNICKNADEVNPDYFDKAGQSQPFFVTHSQKHFSNQIGQQKTFDIFDRYKLHSVQIITGEIYFIPD